MTTVGEHPVCDAIEDGHICKTATGGKDSKVLTEANWTCKKDGESWPCATIRHARRDNAARAGARPLRTLHNTPDRLTGAQR